MISAIALDDEPPALKVIENFCSKVDAVRLEKTFTRPKEAMAYLKKYPVDLIFLDIEMPSRSGIDFYKDIQQSTMVIFTTAYSEYAVEGFNLKAIDYLLKPYTFQRFQQAVEKSREYYEFSRKGEQAKLQSIYVRADYRLVQIQLTDIIYIESLNDYIRIHLQNQTSVMPRMTLKAIEEKLPPSDFIRVHRSFIIALQKIESVRNKIIHIGEAEIPISRSYEKEFFENFED